MARRRSDGTFTFDLEPDDDDDVAVGAGAALDGAPVAVEPSVLARVGAAVARRLRSWPRRRVIAVGTALAVVVVGAVATPVALAQARQRAWERTAVSTPGAVLDLSHEPAEVWRVALTGAQPVALVSGTLVVNEAQWAGAPTLYGLDPATGEVRWATEVPDGGECAVGTIPWVGTVVPRVGSGDRLVCVSDDQRRVGVVDGDGVLLASRELADRPGAEQASPSDVDDSPAYGGTFTWADRGAHRVHVHTGGELLRIDRLGELAAAPLVSLADDAGGAGDAQDGAVPESPDSVTLLDPLVTRDVRVRAEDAVTGAVRWETVLDVADLPAGTVLDESSVCLGWEGEDRSADPEGQWSDALGADELRLTACGLDAVLDLATGEVVEQRDATAGDPWMTSAAITLPDGGWATLQMRYDPETGEGEAESQITRADGTGAGTIPGLAIPPLATDGARSALLVTAPTWEGRQDGAVVAYDADTAEQRWSAPLPQTRLLARTADVVVVSDGRTVTGLDWATGATRWQQPLRDESPETAGVAAGLADTSGREPDGGYWIRDAFTDGRRVLIATPESRASDDAALGPGVLTTLDLATGDPVWEATTDWMPYPIAGRLIGFTADAVVGLE